MKKLGCQIYSFRLFLLFIFIFDMQIVGTSYAIYPVNFNPDDETYILKELLVRFAPKENGIQRNTLEKSQILNTLGGGIVKRNFSLVPGLCLVKLPEELNVKQVLNLYNQTKGILYAEPNYKLWAISTFPNDSLFGNLWGMHNTGQVYPKYGGGTTSGTPDADIDAPESWGMAQNSDIIVAVIDTGVDYTHPDLISFRIITYEESERIFLDTIIHFRYYKKRSAVLKSRKSHF